MANCDCNKEVKLIAISFSEFCRDCCFFTWSDYKWRIDHIDQEGRRYSNDELFDYFIENIFKPNE
jgi:hypothetical protein